MENKSKTLGYLNIPRSSFYYKSILLEKDQIIRKDINTVLNKHPSYGHKRISIELKINHKRVRRIMKKFAIKPYRKRKKPWKQSTDRDSKGSSNILASLYPLYKNHIWITDFTYLKYRNKWVYVCTIIDLFTREVVGVSIKTNHSSMLVSEALLNALSSNSTPSIIHSDQGIEYRSKLFRSILKNYKILQSMSKKGSPWQNGYQESFFSNWKIDIGDVNRHTTLGELTAVLYQSIYYYNNQRIHTSLKMSPRKFADQYEINYNTTQERTVV